jgi:hypothetical protein
MGILLLRFLQTRARQPPDPNRLGCKMRELMADVDLALTDDRSLGGPPA